MQHNNFKTWMKELQLKQSSIHSKIINKRRRMSNDVDISAEHESEGIRYNILFDGGVDLEEKGNVKNLAWDRAKKIKIKTGQAFCFVSEIII